MARDPSSGAAEFFSEALAYLDAAEILLTHIHSAGVSSPYYLVVGRTIELALKAFLSAQGVPVAVLRKRPYGHDLPALLGEAQRRGLHHTVELTEAESRLIRTLNSEYALKRFEYRVEGSALVPKVGPIFSIASKLVSGLDSSTARHLTRRCS